MTELTINSVPSNAQVQIDGEIVGTTPLTYTIGEYDDLAEFRDECMSGGNVVCSWNVLKNRLEDQTVSLLWWFLTESERRSIAEMAIKNTMFFRTAYYRKGMSGCDGGEGEWEIAICRHHATMRYLTFASTVPEGLDHCYWKMEPDGVENCFMPSENYNLPCYLVLSSAPHMLVCLHVSDSTDRMDDFMFFQYVYCDVTPGHHQLPHGSDIRIYKPSKITNCGDQTWAEYYVAKFDDI